MCRYSHIAEIDLYWMNHVKRADNKPLNIVGVLFIIKIVNKAASLLADDILIQRDS